MKTLYDLFGVKSTVTQAGLRKAYLTRSKSCHPDTIDRNRKPREWAEANRVSQELNNAYFILRDPITRSEYDKAVIFETESTHATSSGSSVETGADSFRPRPYANTYTPRRAKPVSDDTAYNSAPPPTTHWAYPNTELDGWFGVFAQWLYRLPIADKLLVLLVLLILLAVGGYLLLFALYELVIAYIYPSLITN